MRCWMTAVVISQSEGVPNIPASFAGLILFSTYFTKMTSNLMFCCFSLFFLLVVHGSNYLMLFHVDVSTYNFYLSMVWHARQNILYCKPVAGFALKITQSAFFLCPSLVLLSNRTLVHQLLSRKRWLYILVVVTFTVSPARHFHPVLVLTLVGTPNYQLRLARILICMAPLLTTGTHNLEKAILSFVKTRCWFMYALNLPWRPVLSIFFTLLLSSLITYLPFF